MAIPHVNSRTQSGLTTPPWIGSYVTGNMLLPGGGKLDPAQFADTGAVVATVAAGGAAAGAVTIPLATALSKGIPAETILDFTGAGKYARVTVAAGAGATALTVEALPQALLAADTATYLPYPSRKLITSGILIGRTIAERNSNIGYGPWTAGDAEEYLLAFDVNLGEGGDNEAELYMHGQVAYENFLPNFANLPAATQDRIRALYRCILAND